MQSAGSGFPNPRPGSGSPKLLVGPAAHATIAGVVAAFTVPATPHYKIGKYINRIRENIAVFPASDKESVVLSKMQINVLKSIESSSDRVISPLQSLEDSLHGMVNYIILPLFAFANAGVSLTADHQTTSSSALILLCSPIMIISSPRLSTILGSGLTRVSLPCLIATILTL